MKVRRYQKRNSMETPERITKLETQVESLKEDVADLRHDVKEVHSRISTGNREILDKIESMERRLEQKMTDNNTIAKEQHEMMSMDMNRVSSRIDVLEKWRWMIVGGALAAGFMLGNSDLFSKLFH